MFEVIFVGVLFFQYKFVINSIIVQYVVFIFQFNKLISIGIIDVEVVVVVKKQVGCWGMYSVMGGYWNEKMDGMWSYKWDGDVKGLDVVLMFIWIVVQGVMDLEK